MGIGPSLVVRGTILGTIGLVILLSSLTSAFITLPVTSAPAAEQMIDQAQSATVMQPLTDQAEAQSVDCSIHADYPHAIQQWCPLITRYGLDFGLDPNLLAALILQESGGKSDAYSKSGAVGLMQVMPRDGLAASFMCINGPCFADRPASQELYDPEFNIKFGTRYLAGLLNRYNGDVREALKSYGPKDYGYRYADIVLGIYQQHQ